MHIKTIFSGLLICVHAIHRISSWFLSTMSTLNLSNLLSLTSTPTLPDPLTALLEMLVLLLPNHLYPSMLILSELFKKVSHKHIMSRFVSKITDSLSLQWSLWTKPF